MQLPLIIQLKSVELKISATQGKDCNTNFIKIIERLLYQYFFSLQVV